LCEREKSALSLGGEWFRKGGDWERYVRAVKKGHEGANAHSRLRSPVIFSQQEITDQFYQSATDLKLGVTPNSTKGDYESSRCTLRTWRESYTREWLSCLFSFFSGCDR